MTTQIYGMPPTPEETISKGIRLFEYSGHDVRTVMVDGEPWFVLNDLCAVLEISNPRDVATRIDPVTVGKTYAENSRGQLRETTIVNESGMYEVVIRANGEIARTFRRWITNEVLPAIRKTGTYSTQAADEDEFMALAVVKAQSIIARKNLELAAKDEKIAVLEPKASAWTDLVSSTGSLSFRDAAKVISEEGGVTIGGDRLIKKLLDWGWCFRPAATVEERSKGKVRSVRAYQTQIDAKTLTEKAKTYTDQQTGEKKLSNNPQTRVTGKGLDRIRTRLLNETESNE
ncbi:BRO family protein [Glutamicibacter sp. AGC13]